MRHALDWINYFFVFEGGVELKISREERKLFLSLSLSLFQLSPRAPAVVFLLVQKVILQLFVNTCLSLSFSFSTTLTGSSSGVFYFFFFFFSFLYVASEAARPSRYRAPLRKTMGGISSNAKLVSFSSSSSSTKVSCSASTNASLCKMRTL